LRNFARPKKSANRRPFDADDTYIVLNRTAHTPTRKKIFVHSPNVGTYICDSVSIIFDFSDWIPFRSDAVTI